MCQPPTTAPSGPAAADEESHRLVTCDAKRGNGDPRVRVGFWCPQGTSLLPLAAVLFWKQMPDAMVVWAGEEAESAPPEGIAVDLWLVLCAGDPPAPPVWRADFGGRWAIFPGPASRWTETTQIAVASWSPDWVLSDLLSDEGVPGPWWSMLARYPLVWLPASGTAVDAAPKRTPVVIAVDASVPDWLVDPMVRPLASAHGGSVVRLPRTELAKAVAVATAASDSVRLVLCTRDIVLAGLAERLAAAAGCVLVIAGTAGGSIRRSIMGGRSQQIPAVPESGPIGPWMRELNRLLLAGPSGVSPAVPLFSWASWRSAILNLNHECGRDAGLLAVDVLFALHRRMHHPRRAGLATSWARVVGDDALPALLASPATVGADAALWLRLAGAPTPAIFGLVSDLVAVAPDWVTTARRWGIEHGSGELGYVLWAGGCDCYVFGWRWSVASDACAVMAAARRANPASLEWLLEHARMAGALGDFATAECEIEELARRRPSSVLFALNGVLRAWTANAQENARAPLPPGALAWWLGQVDRHEEAIGASARAFSVNGALCLGDVPKARELLGLLVGTPEQNSWLAVMAWLRGCEELARELWEPFQLADWPTEAARALGMICAQALCSSDVIRPAEALRRLDKSDPHFFDRTWPSNSRCFYRALIHARLGDQSAAAQWWQRALVSDPLAELRAEAFTRAGGAPVDVIPDMGAAE